MCKKLLLISGNFYPEPTGIGKYSGEMVEWLADKGYKCTVITTFPYYPDWKVHQNYGKTRYWYKKEISFSPKPGSIPITIIRCPHYVPTSPTGFKRLLSEFTISFSSYIVLFFLFFVKKFDYVLSIAPPFELGLLGVLYKKLRGAVFIYHMQDLQVDAARELKMIKSNVILNIFSFIERYIIKNADYVGSISEGMIDKIKKKYNREVFFFPNWVDIKIFRPVADREAVKLKYGFQPSDKIFLYSGAIGVKQGLESLINAAKQFERVKHVKFIIAGSGPYKTHLLKLKNDLNLNNVFFLPLQSYANFNSFLNMADFHFILQKKNVNDLVMPSKLSTILAVGGVAIVTANHGTSLHNIMSSSDMGILIEPENQAALEQSIADALDLDTGVKRFNARNYAESNFAQSKILSDFEMNILHNNEKTQRIKRMRFTRKKIALSRS